MLNASATPTRNINFVLHNFSHCSYDVKFALFKSYCTFYYGSSLWNITDKLMYYLYRIIAFIYLNVIICTFMPCILVRINILVLLLMKLNEKFISVYQIG